MGSATGVGTAFGVLASMVALLTARPAIAEPPAATPRITTFRNPVLPGFHPDPSVVRVGPWFYLVNSSFELFPGVPIHRSRDLVHWEPIGHALARETQLPLGKAAPSCGIFAPTIRESRGTFYVITTNVTDGGNFLVTAKDPSGPWSEPVRITGQGGIDPSLFFDDDGKVYLTSTGGSPDGPPDPGIWQSLLDVTTGKILSHPRLVWRGTGGRYPEGPHLYKIGARYYLMISEGGTEYGHMVTIARAPAPWGPFEACPRNPILTQRNTQMDQPIQGTGHADLVQDGDGSWWMVFLGFRPVGGGYWHHLGRETFLAPVRWDAQGWPVVNDGKPIAIEMTVAHGLPESALPAPPVRDDFDGPVGLVWNYLRNPVRNSYSVTARPGWLTLRGTSATVAEAAGPPFISPTFIGRRQEHLRARMATRIDFAPTHAGQEAGLVLYREPHHRYELGIRKAGGHRQVFVRQTIGARLSAITATAKVPEKGPLILQIAATPEEYTLSWGIAPDKLAKLDIAVSRYLSSEVAAGFIGTYVGLYATTAAPASLDPSAVHAAATKPPPPGAMPPSPPAAFDWFDYEPSR
jgi:xylan 1,4-beta-xylosidase